MKAGTSGGRAARKRVDLDEKRLARTADLSARLTRAARRSVEHAETLGVVIDAGLDALERCMTCASGVACVLHPLPVSAAPPRKEPRHLAYAAAYAEGQTDVTREPFAPPVDGGAQVAFRTALPVYAVAAGEPLRGDDLLAWIRASSAEYRRSRGPAAQYESGFHPRSWAKWLGSGKAGARAPAASTLQQAPEGGRTWTPAKEIEV